MEMRIVIPAVSLERGGGTRFLHEIGSGLSDYGHDVHFVVIAGKRFHYQVRGKVSRVPALAPEVMPEADIILPNFYLTVYSSLSGRGMPVRICLSYEPFFVEQPAEAAQTYRIPMPIATISGWLQGVLADQAGRRSAVINPGIDHAVFHPGAEERYAAAIVCIGRPPEQGYGFKGYPQFVQAMAIVKAKFPAAQVIVASPEMKAHGLPFHAALVSAPTDLQLATLLRQATVFVFPSFFEGFGLPPLEAMACGVPVVTTACGGVSDFARDGENCLMTAPGNVDELAQAILRLLRDPPLRARLSAAGIETARPWTWTRAVDQMEYFLKQVLKGAYVI